MSSSTPKSKCCKAPGCDQEAKSGGECAKHYRRRRDYGSYTLPKRRSFEDSRRNHMTPGKTPVQRRREREAKGVAPSKAAMTAAAVDCLQIQTARVFAPLLNPKRYKGAFGGRGSGKSHFFAEMLIERCVIDPTTRAVCIREVQLSLKESVKALIEDKIKKLKVTRYFRVLVSHIEVLDEDGVCQGRIIFMGMQDHTAESIKSLEGYDIAWVEEAQSLSVTSWDLLRPTLRKPGSEIWCSWNPKSPKDPVDAFFRNNPQPNSICVEANYNDNPWFPEEQRQDMEYDRRRDPDRWTHIWGGGYQKMSEARVFKNWRVGAREEFDARDVIAAFPRYGGDWGYSKDPSVAIKIKIVGRKLYVMGECYKVGCEIDHLPELFDKLDGGEMRKWPLIADSARPETISYMQRHGYPRIKAAKKGVGSINEGVEFLKSYDIIVHPDCTHTIEELTLYAYVVDKHTQEILPELDDKDNHVIDSLRYACESVRTSTKAGVLFK